MSRLSPFSPLGHLLLLLGMFAAAPLAAQTFSRSDATDLITALYNAGILNEAGRAKLYREVSDSYGAIITQVRTHPYRGDSLPAPVFLTDLTDIFTAEQQYRAGNHLVTRRLIQVQPPLVSHPRWFDSDSLRRAVAAEIRQHPGYLTEKRLGVDLLDSAAYRKEFDRPRIFNSSSERKGAVTYVSDQVSVFGPHTLRTLEILAEAGLITDATLTAYRADFAENGPLPIAAAIRQIAERQGHVYTAPVRLVAKRKLLKDLLEIGALTRDNHDYLLDREDLLDSTDQTVYLPYLESTVKVTGPTEPLRAESYAYLLRQLEALDPVFRGARVTVSAEGNGGTPDFDYPVATRICLSSARDTVCQTIAAGDRFRQLFPYGALALFQNWLLASGAERQLYYQYVGDLRHHPGPHFTAYFTLADRGQAEYYHRGTPYLALRGPNPNTVFFDRDIASTLDRLDELGFFPDASVRATVARSVREERPNSLLDFLRPIPGFFVPESTQAGFALTNYLRENAADHYWLQHPFTGEHGAARLTAAQRDYLDNHFGLEGVISVAD